MTGSGKRKGDRAGCPYCGAPNDDATGVNTTAPRPEAGDVSICLSCAGLTLFTGEDYAVRKPTAEETLALFADPGVRRAVHAVIEFNRP